ncbi:MAG: alpha/beta fold hydrolase [Candidatus Margulisbacteria bacterium]|nr:alpha/beta fold hydrolase [Candidatus Margulisiibacteriota bacterium]
MPRPQRVKIPVTEELTVIGTYYPVNTADQTAVILIHALGRNRGDWNNLARYLQREGISALSIDLRGHGESIAADRRGWRVFQEQDYAVLDADLEAVLRYAEQNFKFKIEQTGLLGIALGANLALHLAERNPRIAGVVLLSPGLDYKGVLLQNQNYHKALYVICSSFEKISLAAGDYLKGKFTGKLKMDVYDYSGTIISLFRQRFTLPENIAGWFKQVFTDI